MRNGDGPVRDEERGTRELPAESAGTALDADGSRRMADGIDGIPEQARPHPEDEPASVGTGLPGSAEQESPRERRIGGTPGRAEEEARQRATGGTMSEHERADEQGVPGTRHEPDQPAPQQPVPAPSLVVIQ